MSDSRRIIIVLLVLAFASVSALLVKAAWGQQFPHGAVVALLAVGLGQIGLLALWLALGPGAIVGRLGVSLLAVVGFSYLLSGMTRPELNQWLGFLELYLFAVAVPVFLLRRLAGDSRFDQAIGAGKSPGDESPCQWTLAGMMCLMTVVAVALSFARQVDFPRQHLGLALLSCGGFSLSTLFAISVAWRVKRAVWHLPAAALTGCSVGLVMGPFHGSPTYACALAVVSLVQSLVVVIAIDVIRIASSQTVLPASARQRCA